MKQEFIEVRRRVWKLIQQVQAKQDQAISGEDYSTFNSTDQALKKITPLMMLPDMEEDFVLRIHDLNNTTQEKLEEMEVILKKVA
jgi:hypothetical protein